VVELPQLDIKTTDNIQVNVHAVLNYKIVDPVKAVTNVDNLKQSLEELAEVTLSSILRRLSFRDISPIPDEIPEGDPKKEREKQSTLRRLFKKKCTTIFTKIFPKLSAIGA